MIFLIGPTSSGKTSLALKLCKKYGFEIISADSRQIFKYLDVGTGKVPINEAQGAISIQKGDGWWELDGVRIWMYDVVNPDKYFSVVDYRAGAFGAIKEIKKRQKRPLIVGGTGLYIDALLGKNISSGSPPDWKLRKKLDKKSVLELQNMIDPAILKEMNESDINNPRRLIRKIEKSTLQITAPPLNPNALIIQLSLPREELYSKVDLWVDTIWKELLLEIQKLILKGYSQASPMQGIIYSTAKLFLKKQLSEDSAIQQIKLDLHAYIRRQQTWFKKYPNTTDDSITNLVESYLESHKE